MNSMAGNLEPITSDVDIFRRSNFGFIVIIMNTFYISNKENIFLVMGESL